MDVLTRSENLFLPLSQPVTKPDYNPDMIEGNQIDRRKSEIDLPDETALQRQLIRRGAALIGGVTLVCTAIAVLIARDFEATRALLLLAALFIPGLLIAPALMIWSQKDFKNLRLLHQVKILALTDQLTGLRNRRSFMKTAQDMLNSARHRQEAIALLVIDIDHFKRVNDQYGHAVGDEALCHVSTLIQRAFPKRALVARMGGEEFAVMVRLDNELAAHQMAHHLCVQTSTQPFKTESGLIDLTVSVGVSTARQNEKLQEVMLRADKALYRAKNSGRNQAVSAA